jgi:hypothetical protein
MVENAYAEGKRARKKALDMAGITKGMTKCLEAYESEQGTIAMGGVGYFDVHPFDKKLDGVTETKLVDEYNHRVQDLRSMNETAINYMSFRYLQHADSYGKKMDTSKLLDQSFLDKRMKELKEQLDKEISLLESIRDDETSEKNVEISHTGLKIAALESKIDKTAKLLKESQNVSKIWVGNVILYRDSHIYQDVCAERRRILEKEGVEGDEALKARSEDVNDSKWMELYNKRMGSIVATQAAENVSLTMQKLWKFRILFNSVYSKGGSGSDQPTEEQAEAKWQTIRAVDNLLGYAGTVWDSIMEKKGMMSNLFRMRKFLEGGKITSYADHEMDGVLDTAELDDVFDNVKTWAGLEIAYKKNNKKAIVKYREEGSTAVKDKMEEYVGNSLGGMERINLHVIACYESSRELDRMRYDLRCASDELINGAYTSRSSLETGIETLSRRLSGIGVDSSSFQDDNLIELYIEECPNDSDDEKVMRYIQKYMHERSRCVSDGSAFRALLIGLTKIVHMLDIRQHDNDLSEELRKKIADMEQKANEFTKTITNRNRQQTTLEWFVTEMEARIEWNAKEGVPGTSEWHGGDTVEEDAMSVGTTDGADDGVEKREDGREDATSVGTKTGSERDDEGEEDAMSEASSAELQTFYISQSDMDVYFYARTRLGGDAHNDIGISSRIYALNQLKKAAEEAQETLAKFRERS